MALSLRGPTTAVPGWTVRALGHRRLVSLLLAVVVLVVFGVIVVQDHAGRTDRARDDAATAAHDVGLRLQSTLNTRLALTTGIAAYARTYGDALDPAEFDRFGTEIAASFGRYRTGGGTDPTIRSLQIAPDGVVELVWPLAGNEAAVGYDILADPERGDAARAGVTRAEFVLSGPFELVQGGQGLVGRAPIYDGPPSEASFWGFATVVIDFDEALRVAGIEGDVVDGYRIAIRGRDGLGAAGEVFFGSAELFHDNAATTTIHLPEAAWQIAAEPDRSPLPGGLGPQTLGIAVAGLLLAAIVAVLSRRWLDAQARAGEASDHVAALLDSIDGPIISTDADARITHWNGRAADITGIPAVDALGAPLALVVDMLRLRRTGEPLAGVAARTSTDRISRTVEVVVRVDGEDLREIDVAVAARGDGGTVLVGMDTTARREHERLAADIVALEQISQLKDQFVASTSHEMRTPLTSIIGLAELLADGELGELTPVQEKAVGTIGRAGQHLLAVVNQVLDMASITANGIELELETIDLAELVEPVAEMVTPIADAKQVELHLGLADVGSVAADRARLGEVVLNLLSNAVKFTEPGGQVGIDLDRDDDGVTIAVWDTGVGVPADKQHLLFRPFVRIENNTAASGTGLGLSIAAEVVRLHGGTISVESDPGRLTTFTVSLPSVRSPVPA